MKKYFILLFIVYCSLQATHCFAQDTLLLMNGMKKAVKVLGIDESLINYQIIHRNNRLSGERFIDKTDVYSLKYANGKKNIMFPDTVSNYYLAKMIVNENIFRFINHDLFKASRAELEAYISGEQYAINNYKPNIVTVGGVASGLMGGYLAFFGLLIPTAYIAGASSQSPEIRNIDGNLTIPSNKVNDIYFTRGYKDKARKIDFKRSFIGGLAGFTAMIIVKNIYSANKH